MISRPCVTKSNEICQNEKRTVKACRACIIVLFLLIKYTALMCQSNVFVINELKLLTTCIPLLLLLLFSPPLKLRLALTLGSVLQLTFVAKTASLEWDRCVASICWNFTGISESYLLNNSVYTVLKLKTSCSFYTFVVSQYRESGVHFIEMYELVYNI